MRGKDRQPRQSGTPRHIHTCENAPCTEPVDLQVPAELPIKRGRPPSQHLKAAEMLAKFDAFISSGLTQTEIASELGVSQPTVCRFMSQHYVKVWARKPVDGGTK